MNNGTDIRTLYNQDVQVRLNISQYQSGQLFCNDSFFKNVFFLEFTSFLILQTLESKEMILTF